MPCVRKPIRDNRDDPPPWIGGSASAEIPETTLIFPDRVKRCKYGKRCRREDCKFLHETSRERFINILSQAKKKIDVCVFTITCNDIANALLNLYENNVKVRIISDINQIEMPGSKIANFRRAHIPVRVNKGDERMHHKFAVIDDHYLIDGSFNWTKQGMFNYEHVFVTSKPEVREPLITEFENIWTQFEHNPLPPLTEKNDLC